MTKEEVTGSQEDTEEPVLAQCVVVYAYEAANADELSLKEGQIVGLISKNTDDPGWWRGKLDNKIGLFPDNFVRLVKRNNKGSQPAPRKRDQEVKDELRQDTIELKQTSKALDKELKSKLSELSSVTKELEKSRQSDQSFDKVQMEAPKRLSHPTATRAKAPKRRPPSAIFLKENLENKDTNENGDKKDNHNNEFGDCKESKESKRAEIEVAKMEEKLRRDAEKKAKKTPPPKPPPPKTTLTTSSEPLMTTSMINLPSTSATSATTTSASMTSSKTSGGSGSPKKPEWLEELSRKQANRRSGGHILAMNNEEDKKIDKSHKEENKKDDNNNSRELDVPDDGKVEKLNKPVGRVASMRLALTPTSPVGTEPIKATKKVVNGEEAPKLSIWEKVQRLEERLLSTEQLLSSEVSRLQQEIKEERLAREKLQVQVARLEQYVSENWTKM